MAAAATTTTIFEPMSPSNTRVGWIGTGVMGRSMCNHLIKAGYKVTVFNRMLSKAQPLIDMGARLAQSPLAVASQSDVVFSIVGFPSDVRSVLLDSTSGALPGLRPGGVLVDMTTSEPSLSVLRYFRNMNYNRNRRVDRAGLCISFLNNYEAEKKVTAWELREKYLGDQEWEAQVVRFGSLQQENQVRKEAIQGKELQNQSVMHENEQCNGLRLKELGREEVPCPDRTARAVRISAAATIKGCHSVDAPVSGGDRGAKNGSLAIFAGGDKTVIDRLSPLFALMGRVNYMGATGKGQFAKLANQITIASTMVGLVEGIIYAHKAGLNVESYLNAISTGAAGSKSLDLYGSRILKGDFEAGFYVNHFVKDLGICLKECQNMGLALPGLALAQQLYLSLKAHGEGNLGTQALILTLERLNNVSLENLASSNSDAN
ncbi:hypothetical protein DKX38_028267 [Salix brachista]|uniref:6-phosphogluconate dehydrogenase NADP-binding domain-containing protein n=1 Tax=Salix brachista TaxID=2182728 RepID=A0A5N5J5D1_9ROSI|nr:hypothetical protein DKX38_028267 [Salix brachista]